MSDSSQCSGNMRRALIPGSPPTATNGLGELSTVLNKQRLAKLRVLETALKDAAYNTPTAREAIYANGRTGFSQLYANAIIVAELAGTSKDGSILNGKFPPEIALLLVEDEGQLFRLVTRSELNTRLKVLGVDVKWSDLTTRIAAVPGINCIIYRTTVSYLNRFLSILEWYTNCDFFQTATFIVKKQRKDGEADDYYFTPNHGLELAWVHQFYSFQHLINVFLGQTALRGLNTSAVALTRTLNLAYAKYIGKSSTHAKDNTTTLGVLVFGIGNFRSDPAKLFLEEMRRSLNKSRDTGKKNKQIFTISSRTIPLSSVANADPTTQSDGEKHRNLYTKFGSPYLLADIVRQFRPAGKTLQFTHVYLDHYIDKHSCALQEKALTDFYATTIPLLYESKLLSEDCKIIVPFNDRTVYHLHKAWPSTKAFASVKFTSNWKCNRWYKACETVSNSNALQRIENRRIGLKQCIGTKKGELNSYLEGKIGCELKLFDKRAAKHNKKRKKANQDGEQCYTSTSSASINELRTFSTKWSGYDENQIEQLKWIQLTVLGAKQRFGDYKWPDTPEPTDEEIDTDERTDEEIDTPEPADEEIELKEDLVLTCNCDRDAFDQYETGLVTLQKITLKFKDGTEMELQSIYNKNAQSIHASNNPSNLLHPSYGEEGYNSSLSSTTDPQSV